MKHLNRIVLLLSLSVCQRSLAGTSIPVTMDQVCKSDYFIEQDYCKSYKYLGEFVYNYEQEMREKNYGAYLTLEIGLIVARQQLEIKDRNTQWILKNDHVQFIYRRSFP